MNETNRSLLETIQSLLEYLHPAADRGQLFGARDRIRDLGEALAGGSSPALAPLCTIAERLTGHVLRNGSISDGQALAAVKDLLTHVAAELKANLTLPASGEGLTETQFRPRILHDVPPAARAARLSSGPPPAGDPPPWSRDIPVGEPQPGPATSHVRLNNDEVDESRLGEILVQCGHVSAEDMHRALGLQQVSRGRLGDILTAMGLVDEFRLREALERQRELTLQMARGLQGHPGGLELRIGRADLGRGESSQRRPAAG